MVHATSGLSVVYNGEIYNHVELRNELTTLGHRFVSTSDTEVLLAAWAEWGPACLDRLNGMFAFVLLDPRGGGKLHAVRDRFGVKPLYFARIAGWLAFASEIKQLRSLPGFSPRIDRSTVRDYLASGLVDHSQHTFDERIRQILGGHRAEVKLTDPSPSMSVERWYQARISHFRGRTEDAAATFRDLLEDSVSLRLRADVAVGSCLSGGLDSSAIVCMVRRALDRAPSPARQVTVTARFADPPFDEWPYARAVIAATQADAVEIWPTIERLQDELDRVLWHLDEPFGSTSMFSQWCVFCAAAGAGLKVMLDGQGSDEQLAGYGGNEGALVAGLLRRGALLRLGSEIAAFRRKHGHWPLAQGVDALRQLVPRLAARMLPAHVNAVAAPPRWMKLDAPSRIPPMPPRDLNESLRRQTFETSLPALLRYEDRNSMAWSVEARVPFLDYRLVEFVAGLPDHLKLARGVTKVVLRQGLSGVLPDAIRDRRDKMGFVTPEEVWLRSTATTWFHDEIGAALDAAPEVFDADQVRSLFTDVVSGRAPFTFAPWRILCFGRWVTRAAQGARMAA